MARPAGPGCDRMCDRQARAAGRIGRMQFFSSAVIYAILFLSLAELEQESGTRSTFPFNFQF